MMVKLYCKITGTKQKVDVYNIKWLNEAESILCKMLPRPSDSEQ